MATAAVENPANSVAPHKKELMSSIPDIDTLEGFGQESDDQYQQFKKLQRQLEYIGLQEEYIKDEQRCDDPGCGPLSQSIEAKVMQESEARVGQSTRRDQAYSECTARDRAVHGGHRPEVSLTQA